MNTDIFNFDEFFLSTINFHQVDYIENNAAKTLLVQETLSLEEYKNLMSAWDSYRRQSILKIRLKEMAYIKSALLDFFIRRCLACGIYLQDTRQGLKIQAIDTGRWKPGEWQHGHEMLRKDPELSADLLEVLTELSKPCIQNDNEPFKISNNQYLLDSRYSMKELDRRIRIGYENLIGMTARR